MSTTLNLREIWYDFLYRSKEFDPFPLQMIPPSTRPVVASFDAFCGVTEFYDGRAHCYYGVYPEELKWLNVIDLIWFEIDYNDHVREKTRIAAKRIDSFLEGENISYRRVDSGNRGLHYYLLHTPVKLANPQYCIQQWVLRLPEIPKTVRLRRQADGSVKKYPASGYDKNSGNMNQMVRIPFTIHPKTGVRAVEYYGKAKFMPTPEIRPWEVNSKIHSELQRFDKEAPKHKPYDKEVRAMLKHWPQCIFDAVELLRTPDAISHDQSRHLATFLWRIGWEPDAIVAFFKKNRPDFSESKCSYQVRDIVSRRMFPSKCINVRRMGLCPEEPDNRFKWCPFYPNMMKIMLSIAEEAEWLKTNGGKT